MKLVLIVLAVICFAIKGLGIPTGQIDCMNLGFAFLTAGVLLV